MKITYETDPSELINVTEVTSIAMDMYTQPMNVFCNKLSSELDGLSNSNLSTENFSIEGQQTIKEILASMSTTLTQLAIEAFHISSGFRESAQAQFEEEYNQLKTAIQNRIDNLNGLIKQNQDEIDRLQRQLTGMTINVRGPLPADKVAELQNKRNRINTLKEINQVHETEVTALTKKLETLEKLKSEYMEGV